MKTISGLIRSDDKEFPEAVNAFLPQYALVPFNRLSQKRFKCAVSVGDHVREGQIIAVPLKSDNGIDAAIHAPIPGKVMGVGRCCLPDGRLGLALKIKLEGSFTFLGKKMGRSDWKQLPPEDILRTFLTKGVVNTFDGTPASLALQILKCKLPSSRFLVVRLFDEDPSRMTDTFVASRYEAQIMEGAAITARAMAADGIIFILPRKHVPLEHIGMVKDFSTLSVEVDDRKYPTGFRENIVQQVRKFVRNSPNEAFAGISRRCVFVDSGTLHAVYEAVVLGIPVMERFVHVTGSCLRSAGMFRVKIGTTIGMLAAQCGGFKSTPAKIIVNGMATGFAVNSLDMPVDKEVKAVAFVPADELRNQTVSECVRCGRCRRACPEGIFPDLLAVSVLQGGSLDKGLASTALLCSGCSLCSSSCPSMLPLSQTIAIIRKEIHEVQ